MRARSWVCSCWVAAVAVAWPVGAGAQAKVCAGHPTDPSVVCARDRAHIVDICDRAADGHRVFARVVTKSTYPAYRAPYYDSNDSKEGCSNLHFPSQVVSIQTCVQSEGCGAVQATGVAPPDNTTPPPPTPTPTPVPTPAPTPAPHAHRRRPQTGAVQLGVGLECAPRGKRMLVTLTVHKRKGHAKPRVKRVVFYYRKKSRGKRVVARTDRSQAVPADAADPARPARTTSTPAPTTSARAARSCAGRPWCAASRSAPSRLIHGPRRGSSERQRRLGRSRERAAARRRMSPRPPIRWLK